MKSNTAFVQGQRHFLKGEYDKSIRGFSGALEAGMNAARIHIPLGLAFFKNLNFSEAAAEFSCALQLDPHNDYLYFLRGMAHSNQGESSLALDDLNEAIRLNNRRGAAFVARSLVFRALHRNVAAESDLQSAVELADVEVELFIREYCLTRTLQALAMSLFDVEKSAWGRDLWERRTHLTH